jgi:V8-like Glu-specific endopeptidase
MAVPISATIDVPIKSHDSRVANFSRPSRAAPRAGWISATHRNAIHAQEDAAMASPRAKNVRKSAKATTQKRPLSIDELANIDNAAAAERMPARWARHFARKRIVFSVDGNSKPSAPLVKANDEGTAWSLELPEGSDIGLPGRSKTRIKHPGKGHSIAAPTDPHCPAWANKVFHPKHTGERVGRLMKSLDGRTIHPHVEGVFGSDDRQVFKPQGAPWQSIGRLFRSGNVEGGASGSATLVGPRHVLTASHMVPWQSDTWSMRFVPGYYDGVSVVGMGAESWVTEAVAWQALDNVSAYDMALLRLEDPLGDALGWFGTTAYNQDWDGNAWWQLIGYPGMLAGAERPSAQANIAVLDADTDGTAAELEHHGDSTPGDSGGPLFGFWQTPTDILPYVIGTVSGSEKTSFLWWDWDVDNIAAGGQALVDLVRWGQQNWP